MMIKLLTYVPIFLTLNYSFSQHISGSIVDKLKKNPIAYATVYNPNEKVSTFTDINGKFRIPGNVGDTLKITHLGYAPLEIVSRSDTLKLILNEQILKLKEVVVFDKVTKETLGYSVKKKWSYGLVINNEYALLIKNPLKKGGVISELLIPIRNIKGLSNEGVLIFQFCYKTPAGMVGTTFSKSFVVQLPKKREINLKFNNNITCPNDDFFLVFKRAIPDLVVHQKKPNVSANPFFYSNDLSKKTKNNYSHGTLFIKDNFFTKGKWLTADKYRKLCIPNDIQWDYDYLQFFNVTIMVETH